jgi:Ca2+-transporting ATPase
MSKEALGGSRQAMPPLISGLLWTTQGAHMPQSFEGKEFVGLNRAEAQERLREVGPNELPSAKPRGLIAIVWEVVREPMFLLLVVCGAVYLTLGDVQEALMLLGFVLVVMGITLYQERKTERALEALRDLSSPRARVIRDGQETRIAGREVVPGDVLLVSEGDRVPADAVVLSCFNLSADESLLTGESVPVRKATARGETALGRPGGDDLPFIYSGTLVVQGQGIARVLATGIRTELGKIGKALQTVETEETLLQRETARLVRSLAWVGASLCAVVVVAYGFSRGNWMEGVLAAIALAMAMLPEELPVVLTIFLALGAWRISQKRVLTRRVPAVETVGSVTVLCVDKTGTLTLNQMSVARLFAGGRFHQVDLAHDPALPDSFHELVECAVLASQVDPFDPMEKAIRALGEKGLANTEHLHADWDLLREYPLSPELLAVSRVWDSPEGAAHRVAAKGAPEAIADLCHLDGDGRRDLSLAVESMAQQGLRVLGVARARVEDSILPPKQHDFAFDFIGLLGLADPVRPGVSDSVRECHAAGIRVVMITGDYPATAQNIARQIDLAFAEAVMTGAEMNLLDDDGLRERVRGVNVFARVVPEQKLRLVNALKANGEIVAMTGDGVNDAPALKAAHIGIAMGGRGTDVARESASLVLLDDDFSSIVRAVRLGRRIFDNIRKAVAYVFAIHVPIAGLSLLPLVLKWPMVLEPVHIVFLELIIDPACSIVFEAEPEEADVMSRPPRDPHEPLFARHTLGLSLLQGVVVLAIVLAVFGVTLARGQGELEARALTFATLIVANLSLILANRSWSRTVFSMLRSTNRALWWVVSGATAFLGLILYVPFLRRLFHLGFLHGIDLLLCFAAGVLGVSWFEIMKLLRPKRAQT